MTNVGYIVKHIIMDPEIDTTVFMKEFAITVTICVTLLIVLLIINMNSGGKNNK
jgi:hypothetical protein